jgi:hypothetical protein
LKKPIAVTDDRGLASELNDVSRNCNAALCELGRIAPGRRRTRSHAIPIDRMARDRTPHDLKSDDSSGCPCQSVFYPLISIDGRAGHALIAGLRDNNRQVTLAGQAGL